MSAKKTVLIKGYKKRTTGTTGRRDDRKQGRLLEGTTVRSEAGTTAGRDDCSKGRSEQGTIGGRHDCAKGRLGLMKENTDTKHNIKKLLHI